MPLGNVEQRYLEVAVDISQSNDAACPSSVISLVSDDIENFLQVIPAHHALLKINYPDSAALAREQKEHLANALYAQDLKLSALLIESAARYLVFSEPREAWEAYCCLRFETLASNICIYRVDFYRDSLAEQRVRQAIARHCHAAPANGTESQA
ncbi:hypothetical protein KVQ82_01640 [Pseudomonas sp. AO-1]|uniref:hypothetical protein n=1 Tax=unclassified Pseudomonas TaxID=196821 RepID=UPI001C768F1A|nr:MULTISPECIES: hypothetical protein [unclassified Pseudomonas]QXZ14656.1 hypothetical protein KVQ82_01640 [Pseudomonas sp. AO-1]